MAILLVALLAHARVVRAADEPARVALIDDPGDTTILPRLVAELSGLGLDVRKVPKNEPESLPGDLVEAARKTSAVAAFRVVMVGDRADVWIADRMTGKVVLREMLPRGPQIDGRLVALRAVELLRASLIELDLRRPSQGEVPPPVSLAQAPGLWDELERFALAADSAFLWSPGGTSPAAGVKAAVAWRPSWLGLRLGGGSMLAPATLTRSEGRGEVVTRWLGLDATLQPKRARLTWRPRVGVGIAALSTQLHGVATSPLTSNQQTVYTLSPTVSADLGVAVLPRLRLGLGISYLRPLRGVDIVVAGATVASYGQDILLANLGLEIVLP